MKTTTYKISAGSIPTHGNVKITGQHLYVENDTQVLFDVKEFYDRRRRFNIPVYIPTEKYYEFYNWTQNGINQTYFAESDYYSATNYLYSGYYNTVDKTALSAEHKVEYFNPFKIEKHGSKWTLLSSNNYVDGGDKVFLFQDTGTNTSIDDITNWTNLSGGNNAPGKFAVKTRKGNSLSKIIADYGDGSTEVLDLSFSNKLLNPFDGRYNTVSGFGTPIFYTPKEPWYHTYNTFNNSISSPASIKLYYENGYYIDYEFAVYKSNENLLDEDVKVIESQSFYSEDNSTLINLLDKQGNIINAIQTDKIDSADSSGTDLLWGYLTYYADTFYNGDYASSLVNIATAANLFTYNGETSNQAITAIKFDNKMVKEITRQIGLSSMGEFNTGVVFNGLNQKLGEAFNFNEFSSYLNN